MEEEDIPQITLGDNVSEVHDAAMDNSDDALQEARLHLKALLHILRVAGKPYIHSSLTKITSSFLH